MQHIYISPKSTFPISWVLGVPAVTTKEKSSYTSDLFSLLGTVVLWVYWPSFVAGATPAGTPDAQLQLVHTILSLAAATVTTFGLSSWLAEDGKLRPVDVQNATLAGGVTIGVLAGTPLSAGGALMVGSLAGALSTFVFGAAKDDARARVLDADRVGSLLDGATVGVYSTRRLSSLSSSSMVMTPVLSLSQDANRPSSCSSDALRPSSFIPRLNSFFSIWPLPSSSHCRKSSITRTAFLTR